VTIASNNSVLQSDNLHPKHLCPKLYKTGVGNFFAVVITFDSGLLKIFKIKEPVVLVFWDIFKIKEPVVLGL
jgi:hypothetical protein